MDRHNVYIHKAKRKGKNKKGGTKLGIVMEKCMCSFCHEQGVINSAIYSTFMYYLFLKMQKGLHLKINTWAYQALYLNAFVDN